MPHAAPLCSLTAIFLSAPLACASYAQDLADHFGFDGLEVLRIDPGVGPISSADLDGDGDEDLIVINNHKSRIELHLQKKGATPQDAEDTPERTNDLPEHWRFERVELPAINRVTAVIPYDFDKDGMMDLIYAGQDPAAIVFLHQDAPGTWSVSRRHFESGLMASRNGMAIADVTGDEADELIAIVKGRLNVWPLANDSLGQTQIVSGIDTPLVGLFVADLDGNGLLDLGGVAPDHAAPIRVWLGEGEPSSKALGPQLRFEMPPLREVDTITIPGRDESMIGVIEKASKRVALLELATEPIDEHGDREAIYEVFSFEDPGARQRIVALVDLHGDGTTDVLATNADANAVSVFATSADGSIEAPVLAPSYAELSGLTAGDLDADGNPEVYLVSESEGVVGRSHVVDGTLSFPEVIPITPGQEPMIADVVALDNGPALAVVTKKGRKHVLELIGKDNTTTLDLGSSSQTPQKTLALDVDSDGFQDLLLLSDRGTMLLLGSADEFTLVDSPGQEKLLRAAGDQNTIVFDLHGNGQGELLVADRNFVRGLAYKRREPNSTDGGWEVTTQFNAPRTDINFVALASLSEDKIAAADRETGRIVLFERNDNDAWNATDTMTLRGFSFHGLKGGNEQLLAIGDNGFAVVRLSGEGNTLKEVSSWRPEDTFELPHEFGIGDVNADGMLDVVVLDAGRQRARILGLSELRALLPALSFEVFESRIFSGGEPRSFQPSQVLIADLTGDGFDDLVLLAHDRILLYPQDTADDS